jgi:hypothetical protein
MTNILGAEMCGKRIQLNMGVEQVESFTSAIVGHFQ